VNDTRFARSSYSQAVVYDYRVIRASGPLFEFLWITTIAPGNEETMRDPTLRGDITGDQIHYTVIVRHQYSIHVRTANQ
jgi:hypothetical protein